MDTHHLTDVTKGCWNSWPSTGILCKKTARVGQNPLPDKPNQHCRLPKLTKKGKKKKEHRAMVSSHQHRLWSVKHHPHVTSERQTPYSPATQQSSRLESKEWQCLIFQCQYLTTQTTQPIPSAILKEAEEYTNLKRTMKPQDSKIMPNTGHPIKTRKKPNPNEIVPCQTSVLS